MNCPKCLGYFMNQYSWCPEHQKEYDAWLSDTYIPQEQCSCGSSSWVRGKMEMAQPIGIITPMEVYRCAKCDSVKIEQSKKGTARIVQYKD